MTLVYLTSFTVRIGGNRIARERCDVARAMPEPIGVSQVCLGASQVGEGDGVPASQPFRVSPKPRFHLYKTLRSQAVPTACHREDVGRISTGSHLAVPQDCSADAAVVHPAAPPRAVVRERMRWRRVAGPTARRPTILPAAAGRDRWQQLRHSKFLQSGVPSLSVTAAKFPPLQQFQCPNILQGLSDG